RRALRGRGAGRRRLGARPDRRRSGGLRGVRQALGIGGPGVELLPFLGRQTAKWGPDVLPDRETPETEEVLERSLPRKPLDEGPKLAETSCALGARVTHDSCDIGRKRRRECRDRAHCSPAETLVDQGLRSDEDVEARKQIPLEALPGRVRDLEPRDVGGVVAETLEDGGRDWIARRRGELVHVERQRSARGRSREEVAVLRTLVEREVRR